MLLTISTTYYPASEVSFLFHKHPSRVQEFEINTGKVHVFYPEIGDERCTLALVLDLDPVALVRRNNGPAGNDFALQQYVNDRPYVASSFMSAAISKSLSSALNGRCKDRPELAGVSMPWEVTLAVLPVRGGEQMLRHLFEPLGYTVAVTGHKLNEHFPDWGQSPYYTVHLNNHFTLQQLLSHLYVLIPVCDNDKHYWIGDHEVVKLLEKGKEWLPAHPDKELITRRYLKHQRSLADTALEGLQVPEDEDEEESGKPAVASLRPHQLRLETVRDVLVQQGIRTVADLGCGEGKLLQLLLAEKQFTRILGMDVSFRQLQLARRKLRMERLPAFQQDRIQLIHGSLTYRDDRLQGFDAAVLVEVIEHLDMNRLGALEKAVFQYARPKLVVITTPNAEYNVKFAERLQGDLRHTDHRFEWTRAQFTAWGDRVAERHGYAVSYQALGDPDPEVGALSQLALFTKTT